MKQQNDKLMVSVMGDSISTYEGFVPDNYHVFFTGAVLQQNAITSVNDMWWAKVNQHLHADICVCNAYSGSRVSGNEFPSMSSDERISVLHKDECFPDIILIYAGLNDFGYCVPIKGGFQTAYHQMLQKIKANYPDAVVFCGTLMKSYVRNSSSWTFSDSVEEKRFDDYNSTIREAAAQEGCILVDLASLQIKYETLDGSHPTYKGHMEIAQCWIQILDSIFDVLKLSSKYILGC